MYRSYCHGLLALVMAAQMTGTVYAAETVATSAVGAKSAVSATKLGASRASSRSFGFLSMLQQTVGLSAEQQDTVRGLLADQRQQVAALHDKTDARIRAVLTPEQQKKFDTFLSEQKAARASKKNRK